MISHKGKEGVEQRQELSTAYLSRQQKITGHLNKVSNKSRRDQNKRHLRGEQATEELRERAQLVCSETQRHLSITQNQKKTLHAEQ